MRRFFCFFFFCRNSYSTILNSKTTADDTKIIRPTYGAARAESMSDDAPKWKLKKNLIMLSLRFQSVIFRSISIGYTGEEEWEMKRKDCHPPQKSVNFRRFQGSARSGPDGWWGRGPARIV